MDMELSIAKEELHVGKGKRTKRLRPLSPCAVATATITSSSSSASGGDNYNYNYNSFCSTTDHEEEDMAKCLILLAQGKGGEKDSNSSSNKDNKRRMGDVATTAPKIGFYIYECKTCNRTFPSFQALGGHRASHKRPKVGQEEKSLPPITRKNEKEEQEEDETKQARVLTPLPISLSNINNSNSNKPNKVHECSICGSEFASGQALGGHMRRHRASTAPTNTAHLPGIHTTSDLLPPSVEVKPRKLLELDLNLPAPEDDHRDSNKFQFTPTATQNSMLLSIATPPLVGCHY